MSVGAFARLHPAVQYHIVNSLRWQQLRPQQLAAIVPILAGHHCLVLAPTAGGKTEAALLPVLSRMLAEDWRDLSVLYICPLKALLNDLEHRLSRYAALVGRRVQVWHGDISHSAKTRSLREAPDILLTTPESLEGMLISQRLDRPAWFGALRVAIIDELHAFAGDDRGWHLRSLLGRLGTFAAGPIQRIGLSATIGNPQELLGWLTAGGVGAAAGVVVGEPAPAGQAQVTIDFVGNIANAATVISRLHRGAKRLVFCDSRARVEELSSALRDLGVRTFVSHASLSLAQRHHAEQAFGQDSDCVIVATSTLELGIDVGDLDHVIGVDWPQRVAWVEPSGEQGKARWMASSQALGYALCQGVQRILCAGGAGLPLSRRAQAKFQDLLADLPQLNPARTTIEHLGVGVFRWWTFAGGRANATLAALLIPGFSSLRSNDFYLEGRGAFDGPQVRGLLSAADAMHLTRQMARTAPLAVKFVDALPQFAILAMTAARVLDLSTARAVVGQEADPAPES